LAVEVALVCDAEYEDRRDMDPLASQWDLIFAALFCQFRVRMKNRAWEGLVRAVRTASL